MEVPMEDRVEAVRAFCFKNYNRYGWSQVAHLTTSELELIIGDAKTKEAAINKVYKEFVKPKALQHYQGAPGYY